MSDEYVGKSVVVDKFDSKHDRQIGKVIGTFQPKASFTGVGYTVKFENGDIRNYLPQYLRLVRETSKFKVGDKVRCVEYGGPNGDPNKVNVGKVFTVVHPGRSGGKSFVRANSKDKSVLFVENELELVTESDTEETTTTDYIVVKYRDSVRARFTADDHVMLSHNNGNLVIRTKTGATVVAVFNSDGFTHATIRSE